MSLEVTGSGARRKMAACASCQARSDAELAPMWRIPLAGTGPEGPLGHVHCAIQLTFLQAKSLSKQLFESGLGVEAHHLK